MVHQLLGFKEIIRSKQVSNAKKANKQTRKLLLYLFTSTRGGFTQLRIIIHLLEKPCNTHQLAKELDLDYKAAQHHMKVLEKNNMKVLEKNNMKVLEKNNMVSKIGEKYGAIFHLSNFLEINIVVLNEAIDKLDKKMNQTKIYI